MSKNDELKAVLAGIRKDWKDINSELLALTKTSTAAVTRVDSYLNQPFYKNVSFWVGIAPYIIIFFLAALALKHGGCLSISQYGSVGKDCNIPNTITN
jgi:hypothetical protein